MKPYKCPICLGRGTVPSDFYYTPMTYIEEGTTNTDTNVSIPYYTYTLEVECRTCKGTGVVWSDDLEPIYPQPYYPYYPNYWTV